MGATIVVLGGGVGGLVAANELRRQLHSGHRVVLIERNQHHAFAPGFLWLMTGRRRPDDIRRPLNQLLRRGLEFLPAEVLEIDTSRRRIRTTAGVLSYDFLVVSLGAELTPEAVPGFATAAETFYSFDGALRLLERLRSFAGGRVAVVIASLPYKCPAAPYEGAMLIAEYLRRRGLSAKVTVQLFTPEPQPLPVAGPRVGEAIRQLLKARGVEFYPLHQLTAVEPAVRRLLFANGSEAAYDLLVGIPPHRAPRVVTEAGLTNPVGWIPVDAHTLLTRDERVYAIGDVTVIPLPGRWRSDVPLMLPKAGVFAHAQGHVVAQRIAAEVNGRPSSATFCGHGYCMLETGQDFAGFAYGNFFAQPAPEVHLKQLGRAWHVAKVLFEKWWLAPVGVRRTLLQWFLEAGGKLYGVPVRL